MNRGKKLLKNTSILALGTIFSSFFSFLIVPIFSRWLSADDYGTYDLFLTYTSLLMPFLTLACGEACFRFLLEVYTKNEAKIIISNSLFIVFCGLIIGCIGVVILFYCNRYEQLIPFLCLLVSNVFFQQASFIARGFRKPSVYTIANIVYLISLFISVTYLVYCRHQGLQGVLYGNSIAHLIGIIYVCIALRLWEYIAFLKFDFSKIKEILSYSMPLIPNTISWWVVNVSDRTIISIALGAASNGVYAIACKIPSLCSTMFGVFHLSWQESAVETLNDADRNAYYNSIFNKIATFCISLAMCVLAVNRYMYDWIWDSKYAAGEFQVCILITSVIFSFLAQFIGGIMVAEKRTKANGATTVSAAIINIALNLLLIRKIGLYSASVSTLMAYVALFTIRLFVIKNTFIVKLSIQTIISIFTYLIVVCLQFISSPVIGIGTLVFAIIASICINISLILNIVNIFLNKVKRRKC